MTAAAPKHERKESAPVIPEEEDETLRLLLDRVQRAATSEDDEATPASETGEPGDGFVPLEPNSFAEARLTETEVEALALKYLLAVGEASGRAITDQVRLPFRLVEPLLQTLKQDQVVAHKGSAAMNDYVYVLTDVGRERARRYSDHCTYFGTRRFRWKPILRVLIANR